MGKQEPPSYRMTIGGDYLLSKIVVDRLLKTIDLVIVHLDTGTALEPYDGAAVDLTEAREDFRSTSGL